MGLILLTILLIALIAIGVGTGLAGFVRGNGGVLGTGAALVVVPGIALLSMSMTVVDARSMAIQTSGGRYAGTLDSGFHWVSPWSNTEEWTTRNQTLRFAGDGKDDRDNWVNEPTVTVRLGNQSQAFVDGTITWVVGGDTKSDQAKIEGLWKQYRGFDDMRHDYVSPTTLGAVNAAFDGYDPFSNLKSGDGKNADNPYVSLEEWSKRITAKLTPLLAARGIELVNVQVTNVHYDDKTEGILRQYAEAVARTRIAGQNVETAKKDAEASNARAVQSGKDCLSLIRDLAASDQLKNLPAGTNICGGAGTPVIVGTK